VGAACTSCWGAAASDGCTGDATTCPWVIAVAANSATIGAMASGRLVVDKLLPKKILRLFSYRVLKIISMLYSVRAGEGTAANSLEESTPLANFVGLLTSTKITLEEAIDEISRRIHALDRTAETFDNDLKLLNATMTAVTKVDASSTSSGMYADGARLYVLAKRSRVICVSKALTYDSAPLVTMKKSSVTLSRGLPGATGHMARFWYAPNVGSRWLHFSTRLATLCTVSGSATPWLFIRSLTKWCMNRCVWADSHGRCILSS